MTVESAIGVVAWEMLAVKLPYEWVEWEDVPTITEDDFKAIYAKGVAILEACRPNADRLAEAYAVLEARVENA